MFPRYEYHWELIKKIVDSAHQIDNNIITRDLSKLADSTILVYGRETDVDRNLLQPLILEDENGNYGFNKFCFKDDVHKAYHFFLRCNVINIHRENQAGFHFGCLL